MPQDRRERGAGPAPIVVQKYGGSSVADAERIRRVAARVVETVRAGHRVVVVVSAMGRTTDELLERARAVHPNPPRRELDMLLSAGERVASAILAMAVEALGQPAISFTGSQCGIITTDRHNDARILEVRPYRVQDELDRGRVVIIAGYQGVSYKREVTTLGRGGSDTTAVAMAAALGAEHCEICSDVDGVKSGDPRVVARVRHIERLSYDEMLELASAGAKVLNAEAVAFARSHGIVIYARASDGSGRVTRVGDPAEARPGPRGVAGLAGLLRVRGSGGPAQLRAFGRVLREHAVAAAWVRLDAGQPLLLLRDENLHDAGQVLAALGTTGPLEVERGIEAASVVGEGIGEDPAHLERLLAVAEAADLPLAGVDTAPSRLTLLLPAGHVARAQRALHEAFISG